MPRIRSSALMVVMVLIGTVVVSVGPASARQPVDPRSEHQRIIDFWTADRVERAVPRGFVFDSNAGRFVPTAPGGNGNGRGGGGNGGGDDGGDGGGVATTTGASWESGGTAANATGKVLFSLGPDLYVCSGTVIDDAEAQRSLVLTAAHCAYDHSVGFAQNWMFVPDFDAQPTDDLRDGSICEDTAHGCWTASSLVVHEGFFAAGGFNGTAIQYDFAVAVLGAGGYEAGLVEDLPGDFSQAVRFESVSKGTAVAAFGYPQADPHKGQDLRYCAGSAGLDNRLFRLTYKLECDMTGGASGGGWVTGLDSNGNGTVVSVNSYRYSGGSAIYGPKLNADARAVYDGARTSDGNSIVGG